MQDQIIYNLTTTFFASGNLAMEVESYGSGVEERWRRKIEQRETCNVGEREREREREKKKTRNNK